MSPVRVRSFAPFATQYNGMKIKLFMLLVIIFIIICCLFLLKREVGSIPNDNDLSKFKTLPYFKNGRFINIYNSIDGFKNDGNERYNFDFKTMMKMLFFQKNNPKQTMPIIHLNKNDFSYLPSDFAVYWLGHSNVIFELSGKRIIVDPTFSNAGPVPFIVKRYVNSPLNIRDLPHFDYVLITHNHYDHLERKAIKALNQQVNTTFIVPLGLSTTLIGWGVKKEKIVEIGWGQSLTFGNLIFNGEPAIHFSGRWLNDSGKTLWNSYVIQVKSNDNDDNNNIKRQIFCAGDGGYGTQIDYIAKKYGKYGGFDIATIEIDAWNTGWPYVHMFTKEALEVAKKLNTKYLLPVHWGVYNLAMHNWKTSINMLLDENKKIHITNILTPMIGEKLNLLQENIEYKNQNWFNEVE